MKLILDRCAGDLLYWNPSERPRWFRGSVDVATHSTLRWAGWPITTSKGFIFSGSCYVLCSPCLLRVTCAAQGAKTTKVPFYQCQFNYNNLTSDECLNILESNMTTNNFMSFSLQSSGLIIHVSPVTTLLP